MRVSIRGVVTTHNRCGFLCAMDMGEDIWAFTRSSSRTSSAHSSHVASLRNLTSMMLSLVCVGVFAARVPASAAERSETIEQAGLVTFNIPTLPLASALEAYGAATGIEVFYDAALAAGHRSAGVKGSLRPIRALEVLLRGTGYTQRITGSDTISIVPSPQDTREVKVEKQSFDRYDTYFAVLQSRLSRILCRDDHAETGSGEVIFKFWLAASGVIARAEIIASGGDPDRDRTIAKRAEGLDVGELPPPGLPEPVTMAVFPPVDGEAPGCPASRYGYNR